MATKARKAMIIGLDGAFPRIVRRMMAEGKLPHMTRLTRQGTFAEHCLPPFPTITPPNWTSLATGALPGTHGITDFCVHVPGDPLDKIHSGFDAREVTAEQIWRAADRAGKRSIVLNYPTSSPGRLEHGVRVGGDNLNAGFATAAQISNFMGCDDKTAQRTFTPDRFTHVLKIGPARGWRNLPASMLEPRSASVDPFRCVPLKLLIWATSRRGYDRVRVCLARDAAQALCELQRDEMSEAFLLPLAQNSSAKGLVRFYLGALTPKLEDIRFAVTAGVDAKGWTAPASLAREILAACGPPHPSVLAGFLGKSGFQRFVDGQNNWLADVARHLLAPGDWDLFIMHAHCIDFVNHEKWRLADPLTGKKTAKTRESREIVEICYRSVDQMIGRIVELADDQTVVVVVSDHGATSQVGFSPLGHPFGAGGALLEKAGYLTYRKAKKGQERQIDWSRTRAVCQRTCHIYLNVKGRDPQGIVRPGEEYERLRDEIIDLLYRYRDRKTGKRPVVLALRREDARMLGHYTDKSGDIVYAYREDFGSLDHGYQLPTAETDEGQQRALCILAGPGIKKGYTLERNMNLIDIVPTLCHLIEDLPVPRDAEGAVVYQALG